VDFAEIEKFIDTPVKRYSSGMYVRLAFAVAAHLEPDILVVDEVLAVGDAQFQKKCLGKMKEASTKEGRTVLFVSHNMQAIRNLCNKGVLLNSGETEITGNISDVINEYLGSYSLESSENISALNKLPEDKSIKILNIEIKQNNIDSFTLGTHLPIEILIEYRVLRPEKGLRILFDLVDDEDQILFRSFHDEQSIEINTTLPGYYKSKATIPDNLLGPLKYKIIIRAGIHNERWCTPDEGIVIPIKANLTGLYNKAYPNDNFKGKLGISIGWETIKYENNTQN